MRIPLQEIKTIDDVLKALDFIIQETIADKNMLGVFAYIYRRTTAEIKTNIVKGKFQDNARMERFDIMFAKYYIEAYYGFKDHQPISNSWKIAFDARIDKLAIAQHILLGMNAHINLDLGVTAAKIMEKGNIKDIEHDFTLVSHILAKLVNEMQARLNRVSRFMFLLDLAGENRDNQFISFSISKAREQSWRLANTVWNAPENQKSSLIQMADNNVSIIGNLIRYQKSFLVKNMLAFIRRFEDTDPALIIKKLSQ